MTFQRLCRRLLQMSIVGLAVLPVARAGAQHPAADAEVVAVVDSFHRSLQSGDSTAVLALLAPDVLIMEDGSSESRDEYRAHHLPDDIEFLRAVRMVRGPIRVARDRTTAWTSATSKISGSFQGRPVDSQGAELLVWSKGADGWRIRAIHWSSQPTGP